ncbi:MAG TPA: cytochrome c oxidase assembly factor Coa1 family protein [Pyrinomonadaceae bacterium]|nr:cytochrome c oxidase assembly factor Coa1 family protein [Pyrinomonadaceae bacterium]
MTTKKIVVIVASIVIVLGFIVVLFVGGIIGAVFYGISNSDAALVAKDFLSNNERLKQDIGEVKDFGKFVTGNINLNNGAGNAELNLKVIGERKQVNAAVELAYRSGHQWRVTAASYKNEAGETIDLLNPYESRKFVVPNWVFVMQTLVCERVERHSPSQTNSLLYKLRRERKFVLKLAA